ncbi:MAG: dual specificity protein phosphatase family protein [Arenicella sp.]
MINFNRIEDNIFIGSAPSHVVDVQRLDKQLKITAILSLQTDKDFRHYKIGIDGLLDAYKMSGIEFHRYPITDFDADDMARKLVAPVKALKQLLMQEHRVYVHCNAGICRAPATVLGYLHAYEGMPLDEGLTYLRTKRPIANPFMDSVRQAMQEFTD